MASQDLKHRHKDDPTPTTTTTTTTTTGDDNNNNRNRRAKKLAMARRGLRSLLVAVAVPLALAILSASLSGGGPTTATVPFWHPPDWAFHVASASTSCLMGLSAWLVWAAGGFHRQPATLQLYLAQLVLSLSWGPLVLRVGATWAGMAVAVALFAVLLGCSMYFRRVNPIAGDLVKPCLAWVSFLAIFNYKLL